MTIQQLAKEVCLLEKGTRQVDIANMCQTLFCLRLVFIRNPLGVLEVLLREGVSPPKPKKRLRSSPRARSTSGKRGPLSR